MMCCGTPIGLTLNNRAIFLSLIKLLAISGKRYTDPSYFSSVTIKY